jgi:hypothetical protein
MGMAEEYVSLNIPLTTEQISEWSKSRSSIEY